MIISPRVNGRREPNRENWSVLVPDLTTVALWTYVVPSRCRFILKDLGNYLGTVAAWGFVVWVLLANGMRQPPYEAILDQIGYAAQRQPVTELEFGGGTTLQITAYNGTALDCQVGISIGWELVHDDFWG